MGSAPKFWPRALFGLGAKKEAPANFTPTTDIAARIIGSAGSKTASAIPTSLDDLDFAIGAPLLASEDDDTDLSRQAERFVPEKTATTLTDKRGKSIRARIINVSSTGVAVEADFRIMPAESVAMVGAKPVTAGRGIRGGQVFVFDKPLDQARCNKQIIL